MKYALSLFALALLAGCPGNQPMDASQAGPAKTSTTTLSPRTPVTTTRIAAPGNPSVDVELLEYQIRMSDTLAAGKQTFRIANGGHEQHGFAIEGPGVSKQLANNLTRGDTAELEVTLQPGTYTVWCPVDGHRGKGMQRTITVHQ
jgi:plastocyanin